MGGRENGGRRRSAQLVTYPSPEGEAAVVLGSGRLFQDQVGTARVVRPEHVQLLVALGLHHLFLKEKQNGAFRKCAAKNVKIK